MKLPNLKLLSLNHRSWTVDFARAIEHIFGFPTCDIYIYSLDRKSGGTSQGNVLMPDELFIRMGDEIITPVELLHNNNITNPHSIKDIFEYKLTRVDLPLPIYKIVDAYTNDLLKEVEYMTAIIEYCFVNDITIPNQERIIKYCVDNNLIDMLNLSKDHIQIVNATLTGNHKL